MMKIKLQVYYLLTIALVITVQVATAQERSVAVQNSSAKAKISTDAKAVNIASGFLNNLRWDLSLDTIGGAGSKIVWTSSQPAYLSNEGKLIRRSARGAKKTKLTLTATLTNSDLKIKKTFNVTIAYDEQMLDGYLFTYFEGSGPRNMDEQIRFGISKDAVNWSALNKNLPVISSALISGTGGVRDPHILRGEDEQSFYMVATDMSTAKNGWGHNPGIVLLKSNNLTKWKHGFIDLEKNYPDNFKNVQWVWAPQTIYDPTSGKYLIYFTVKFKDDPKLDFYAAYANKDFDGFLNEPKLMFSPKYGAIDGDIIYRDGTYHFFFKGNTKDENGKEIKNGIRKAVSKSLQGPWQEEFNYLDAYAAKKIVVEGSSVFKLNNVEAYILMYDLYTNRRYEFQRSEDLRVFSPKPESFTKDFFPRHGSVIGITKAEMKRLQEKWGNLQNPKN